MSRPLRLFAASLAAAVVVPIVAAQFFAGKDVWGDTIGAYSGAALAFTTALFWDRHSRLQDDLRNVEVERARTAERLRTEQERRVVEARRRFGAILVELERLKSSVDRAKREQHNYKHFFPDLPTGSFTGAIRTIDDPA